MTQNKKLAARISKAKELDGGAPVLLSVHEAAARLRVGRSTMQGLIATGKIRSMKIGRVRRVSVESINEYAHSKGQGPATPRENQTIDPFVERGEHSAERLDRIVAVLERIEQFTSRLDRGLMALAHVWRSKHKNGT